MSTGMMKGLLVTTVGRQSCESRGVGLCPLARDFSVEILEGNRNQKWILTTSAITDQLTTNVENIMPTDTMNQVSLGILAFWSL